MTKKTVKKKKVGTSTIVIAVLSVLLTTMLVLNLTGAWFTDREHAKNTLEFGAIELTDFTDDTKVFEIADPVRNETILMPGHTLEAVFTISIPNTVQNIRNAFVRSCIKVTFDGDHGNVDNSVTGRLGEIAAAMGGSVWISEFKPEDAQTAQQYVTKVDVEGVGVYSNITYTNGTNEGYNTHIGADNVVSCTFTADEGATGVTSGGITFDGDLDDEEGHEKAKLLIERFNMIYNFKWVFNKDIANNYSKYVAYVNGQPVPKWVTAADSASTYWNYYYRELAPGDENAIEMDYKYELVGFRIGNALQQVKMVFDLEVQAVQAENLGYDNNTTSYPHQGTTPNTGVPTPGGNLNPDGTIDHTKPITPDPGDDGVYENSGSSYQTALSGYATIFADPNSTPVASNANQADNPRNAGNAIIAFAQVLGVSQVDGKGVITGADVEGAYKPVLGPTGPNDEPYVPPAEEPAE